MKLIKRDTDYAVRALCYIAQKGEKLVSVPELVAELGVPKPFLRKILQILNKKGLVRSHKGLGGGFELAMAPDKIFLIRLMEIFQGPSKLNECFLAKKLCPNRKVCVLKKRIDRIEGYVLKELEAVTIGELIKK